MKQFFITGGTGFLGKEIIRRLIEERGSEIYALVREGKVSVSSRKGSFIEAYFPADKRKEAAERIHFIKGDVASENMGMSGAARRRLKKKITHSYHSAGMLLFNKRLSDIRKVNVDGTKNFLSVMKDWAEFGKLANINHISTAYVIGTYSKKFREDQLDVSQEFNNTYEKSKFEAEKVVERYRKNGMKVNVFRPSLITRLFVGGAEDYDLSLKMAKMIRSGIFKTFPLGEGATVNMVPVEVTVETICSLSILPDITLNKNFHIVNPRPLELITLLTVLASTWGFDLPKLLPADRFKASGLTPLQRKLTDPFLPYMTQAHSFDMKNTIEAIKKYKIRDAYFLKTRREHAS